MNNKNFNKSKFLYNSFLGFLTKEGKIINAKRILDETFFLVSKKMGCSKEVALLKVFKTLNSYVEVKKIKKRKRSFLVPFSINLKRRSYIIIRWLIQTVKQDVKKESLSNKLSFEIINILKGNSTRSQKMKNLNLSQAISNRSNIHYRW